MLSSLWWARAGVLLWLASLAPACTKPNESAASGGASGSAPATATLAAASGSAVASGSAAAAGPGVDGAARVRTADRRVLPWSQQLAMREAWLARRHEMLLPMMRRHRVSMWVVVNEEFHDDPLTEFVAPPRPYAGNRDVFVFVDAGEAGLKRFALTGFVEEHLARFFETPAEPGKQKEGLAAIVATHQPRTIALGIGGRRGVTRSLTRESYRFLVEALGPAAERRFVSAAPLIEEYLDTRLPEEFEPYRGLVELTDETVREALSSAVIAPGKTRVGDVRAWLYDRLWALGLRTWFQPDLRVQRAGAEGGTSRGFLAVAREDMVIERGDLVHIDFGISYLGLHTDWQRMAYVLREGETEAPAGLTRVLADANALQDALRQASRPGRPSAEVYEATMTAMRERGITARVYSHPLGNQGHALGAAIDFRSGARDEAPKPLRLGSYLAMELGAEGAPPEWGGQKVFAMQEDPVYLTDEGWQFFVPRQEAFYLIK
ncbi:MAG: M24 family metallopeptidase [Polyangiaceae bacterium]|nr:M24 family metallopeptidase [Polyangiaceae bacterium]